MREPAQTLVGELERIVSALPDAVLYPGTGAEGLRRFAAAMGAPPPSGLATFLAAHDGGLLSPDTRLLTIDEAAARLGGGPGAGLATGAGARWPVGLWPVAERAGRRYALDAEEANGDGEWPVVEVTEHGVDRVGTSHLRFLHVLCAELAAGSSAGDAAIALAETRCRRDPGHADHWLDLAELLDAAGRASEIDAALASALRAATPPTPALLLAIGMRAVRAGSSAGTPRADYPTSTLRADDAEKALRAFKDAIALEPVGARDDDARLDAAALVFVLAAERGDAATAANARALLGESTSATAAFWRGEALAALAEDSAAPSTSGPSKGPEPAAMARGEQSSPAPHAISAVGALALRIVAMLEPDDRDLPRLQTPSTELRAGLRRLKEGRDALEAGQIEAAVRAARAAIEMPDVAALGAAQAFLAESLNAARDSGAVAAARRATEINPTLVDGWRELGDAQLEAGELKEAEAAFRRVVAMDTTYGLGYAKLAQVLLEQARTLEALEAIGEAARRGGDPFFIAAIRGDIYAEMERHPEAAEAYDQALAIDPEDHWALHQAALEHGFAGHQGRASELFQAALDHDRDGCHQTLVDYGDHLRRMGRIGDAVKLYRRAVAAVPGEQDWKQTLREAERELLAAPN
jgi:tetratricopeptide (TPR) repeat protein